MNLQDFKRFYFLGIGGIGMSALARYFHANGFPVAGYDRTPSELTRKLEAEGMAVHYEDDPENIPAEFRQSEGTLVIYTPAIPKDNKELNYIKEGGFALRKRAEVLAMLTAGKYTIAVAGTHGKTSTAALISHLLTTAGIAHFAFLGGISANAGTNFIAPQNGKSEIIVVEADEFDRSFLQLHPDVAIITALEADHLDIYGNLDTLREAFYAFAKQVKKGGRLIVQRNVMIGEPQDADFFSYSATEDADRYADNVRVENGKYVFDYYSEGTVMEGLVLGTPGFHNIENALAALTAVEPVVEEAGLKTDYLRKALESFRGAYRRFEVIYHDDDIMYVDDYAHHPTEIKVTLDTLRFLQPGKKLLAIFQPHLFSRTRDLAADFAQSLSEADDLVLLPIYPARELPMPGVTSEMILEKTHAPVKKILQKEELTEYIAQSDAQVIVTLGAGDIDRLVPQIRTLLAGRKGKTPKATV